MDNPPGLSPFDISPTAVGGVNGRQVAMEVLSLGMPRTGTASMQAALQLLGYSDVHHGFALVDQPYSSNLWEKAVEAKFLLKGVPCDRAMFDALLGGYAATTDAPSAFFAEELLASYPHVRFPLNPAERVLQRAAYVDTR